MDEISIRLKQKKDVLWILNNMDSFGKIFKEGKYTEANGVFEQIEKYIINEVRLNTDKKVKLPDEYKHVIEDLFWYWLKEL